MRAFVFDALVVFGTLVMTLGVFGMVRMPDLYTRIHAASKAVLLGVAVLLVAGMVQSESSIIMRLALLFIVLMLTTPVASHAIGRAGYLQHERMQTPGAIDESGSHLAEDDPAWRV
ncbi:MAG: monovalent cation/H(+) antiporter subunit G [Thermomicrobiales bacterium]